MKTLNKLSELFKKLDAIEIAIEKHQKTIVITPFKAVKEALSKDLSIRDILEQEIIKVADTVSKELELQKLEKEYNQYLISVSHGLSNPADMFDMQDEIKELKKEIDEKI